MNLTESKKLSALALCPLLPPILRKWPPFLGGDELRNYPSVTFLRQHLCATIMQVQHGKYFSDTDFSKLAEELL
jgi:hypothetical protein